MPEGMTLATLQEHTLLLLTEKYGQEARQLVRMLLTFYTGLQNYQLISRQSDLIDGPVYVQTLEAVQELLNDRPIQYILGSTEFAGLQLNTDARALIPRPETEELVEWIAEDHACSEHPEPAPFILDIGTGTGAIALALKSKIKKARVYALDISAGALSLARKNSVLNELEIIFLKQDILQGITGFAPCSLDIIVSNPPYVLDKEKLEMKKNVLNYEPHLALFVPDTQAMKFYSPIAEFAASTLKKKGFLYMELNEAFARESAETAIKAGLGNITFRNDLQGKVRMMRAQRSE